MSLIHEALKKAGATTSSAPTPAAPAKPGSGEIMRGGGGGGGGGGRRISPVTIGLVAVLVVVGGFMVGRKFFWHAQPASAPVPVAATSAAPETPVEVAPTEAEVAEALTVAEQGEAAFGAGDYQGALTHFEKALETAKDDPELWNNVGLTRKKLNDLPGAAVAYQKALEIKPEQPITLNNLGMLRMAEGDNLTAALHFRKAIELEPLYADAHFNLGVLMEEEGNWRSAIEAYKLYLEHSPTADPKLRELVTLRVEEITP